MPPLSRIALARIPLRRVPCQRIFGCRHKRLSQSGAASHVSYRIASQRTFGSSASVLTPELELETLSSGEAAAASLPVDNEELAELREVPDLAPGDYVEVRRGTRVYNGVLAKVPTYDTFGAEHHTILYNGHFIIHKAADVTFQIPGWAFAKIANSPIPSGFATAGLSLESATLLEAAEISPTVIAHINPFKEAADRYKFEARARFDQAYTTFLENGTASVTIDQVAKFVFYPDTQSQDTLEPTPAELYATFNYLLSQNGRFKPTKAHRMRKDREFFLRSAEEESHIRWMWNEIRSTGVETKAGTKGSLLNAFVTKARKLVEWHRSDRSGTGFDKEIPAVEFTEADQIFLNALKTAALEGDVFPSPYRSIVLSGVLKKMYPLYGNRPRSDDAARMLREIGVWTQWENTNMHRSSLKGRLVALEGHGMSTWADDVVRQQDLLGQQLRSVGHHKFDETGKLQNSQVTRENSERANAADRHIVDLVRSMVVAPAGAAENAFYATDPCAEIRHDFGNLPVYVIDDPTAHELDDGMSIEKTPEGTWVHIHIADPTAYVPPSHPMSLFAQLRGNSVYLPERHYPMMPDYLSDELFNLGISKLALTFSARITENGDIIDYRARPSIVRNMKIIHYDDVDTILDWTSVYGVGRDLTELSPWVQELVRARGLKPGTIGDVAAGVDANGVEELRELQGIMKRAYNARMRNGAFMTDQPGYRMAIEPYPQPVTPVAPKAPYFPAQDFWPAVSLKSNQSGHLSPSHLMVSECMITAGRVASKFSLDGNIPVTFRGQPKILDHIQRGNYPESDVKKLLFEVMFEKDSLTGVIPFMEARRLLPYMPSSTMGVTPTGHYSMGIPGPEDVPEHHRTSSMIGYVKVTSPLRRYKDMVAHWNMKAFMLGQKIPFSKDDVAQITQRMSDIEKQTKVLSQRTDKFWAHEWIRRREVAARTGRYNISQGAVMPPIPVTEVIDNARTDAVNGQGVKYRALVTDVDQRTGDIWVSLVDVGGVGAKIRADRGATELIGSSDSKTLLGTLVDVSVEKADPWRSVLLVRPA
ncbi:hypothetical protein HDU85_007573 [Gaertneriomyces sp. JEL0708]|nr:hypothetical protein HDU85_007573 [Gaertneriomyces sp. JEL0708]